jgi:hypothetical protein
LLIRMQRMHPAKFPAILAPAANVFQYRIKGW